MTNSPANVLASPLVQGILLALIVLRGRATYSNQTTPTAVSRAVSNRA